MIRGPADGTEPKHTPRASVSCVSAADVAGADSRRNRTVGRVGISNRLTLQVAAYLLELICLPLFSASIICSKI